MTQQHQRRGGKALLRGVSMLSLAALLATLVFTAMRYDRSSAAERTDLPAPPIDRPQPSAGTPAVTDAPTPAEEPTPTPAVEVVVEPVGEASSSDSQFAVSLLGRWRGSIQGQQVIEMRPDGTASVVADLNFWASLLYGPRLEMDLSWRVENGVLTQEVLRGVPADKVAQLKKDRGAVRAYQILELDGGTLRLRLVEDPTTEELWTRLP
ncbi:MAG: hypothetical protein R3B90_23265 [Planctomycetaceae bacterium]